MSNKIEILGKNNIPEQGALVIPGRLDFNEMLHLEQLFAKRPITWLCEEKVKLEPAVESFLDREGTNAIAFDATDADPASIGATLRQHLSGGGIIIFFPGYVSAHTAECCHIPGPTIRQLCALGLPVLPLSASKPREIALSSDNANRLPESVFTFAPLIPEDKISVASWRQALLEAEEEAFASRSFLQESLPVSLIAGLKKHGSSNSLYDGTDDSELSFDKLLAVAIVFAQEIKELTSKKRVGVILPPGKGGTLANLAVLLAGKIPVNINFTASHKAVQSSIRQADVDRFITADPFVRKVASFPWPPNRDLIFIERTLPHLQKRIKRWFILCKILPTPMIAKILGLGKSRGDDEAVLLFTSGSSGEPKGVPLSHRNLLANVCQFGSRINLSHESRLLGCLPLFHSFGITATMLYPCLEGLNLVTYPNPLETKRLAELIKIHQVTALIATPTFLRGYMRRVAPEQLSSLQYCVTGAEKLPQSLAEAFKEKFGIDVLEGFGLTETSPATNINLPELPAHGDAPVISSHRRGSVGKLLPGIAVRMTNPATDQASPISEQGSIWLRGANVFSGYLNNQEKTAEIFEDQWFNTGDVGRVDDDGFLIIEGRLSRFSKIAGEMVPHETVEATITQTLGLDKETERKIAVVGIPDEQKGEAIALLTTVCGETRDQECIALRYQLMDQGIPSLWCPKLFIPVDEIPILASGKLDLKACKELAENFIA
ncbi:AMP-binding protein [Verrucomicrobiaceae bacterium N1E253]|uniref:AMP-binding protein n=1 Tax=Oceaniferula marina TaxID=2748318 RepID=A0A851GL47_9BACT|nr:AMP-binding protein [Oceaniferula marina]NWK55460.1 AMP-binding protein [Oceaniferula marina]